MSDIKPLDVQVVWGRKASLLGLLTSDNGISIIAATSAMLQEAILHRSHFIEREKWEDLANEEIQRHSAEFTLEDISHLCTMASVLRGFARDESLIRHLASIRGYEPVIVAMEAALTNFAHWLCLARTLSARHRGVGRDRAAEQHRHDGDEYLPPVYLIQLAELYR